MSNLVLFGCVRTELVTVHLDHFKHFGPSSLVTLKHFHYVSLG